MLLCVINLSFFFDVLAAVAVVVVVAKASKCFLVTGPPHNKGTTEKSSQAQNIPPAI